VLTPPFSRLDPDRRVSGRQSGGIASRRRGDPYGDVPGRQRRSPVRSPLREEDSGAGLGELARVLPRVAPMKAVTGELPPAGDAWAAEIEWDGQLD
jgi:hypothetical protein